MVKEDKDISQELEYVSDEEMDSVLPKMDPYLAMLLILGAFFAYYALWIWLLNI